MTTLKSNERVDVYKRGARLRYILCATPRPSGGWQVRKHRILGIGDLAVQIREGSLVGDYRTKAQALERLS